MCPAHSSSIAKAESHRRRATGANVADRGARGFTLPEVLIAMTIMATLSVVIGGLVSAVNTAYEYTTNTEDATVQGQATVDRIQYMIPHAGVYRTDSGTPTLGIRVVNHKWSLFDLPDVLVIWSGGRDGGIADAGLVERLPLVEELVIYTPSSQEPNRFVEIVVPNDSSEIDFNTSDFEKRILTLIDNSDAQEVLLSNRVRVSDLPAWGPYQQAGIANVRFQFVQTPSDEELASTDPDSDDWRNLMWSQGIVTGETGLRQATVYMEFQMFPSDNEVDRKLISDAIPLFASGSYRYAYQP